MPADPSQSINPLRLAKARERLEGELGLNTLSRLEELLVDKKGGLKYELSFDVDEAGVCIVVCRIETQVILECQRCFKAVSIDIDKSSILGVVSSKEELDALTDEYEPLQLECDTVSVKQLVEDELLLSIPLSAMHADVACAGTNETGPINSQSKLQPFAGLAELMKKKD